MTSLSEGVAFFTSWGGMHGWAMATAALVSVAAAVVGSLLVVRRMSLIGDAISHAVLPGIVVGVLLGGRPGGPLATLGAVAAALVTVWLAELLQNRGRLSEDSAAGVVFTTLFAAGVALLSAAASRVDADPGCVLYGMLELVPFDVVNLAGFQVPRGFVTGAVVLAILLAALWATWRWQLATAFDADAAAVVGLPARAITVGLLCATAVVTVASFEAVGAIIVVAMLVVPAATAELLTSTLVGLMLLATGLAVTASCGGYVLAWQLETNAAGMIASVLGGGYGLAILFSPEGILARVAASSRLRWRVVCEDVLAAAWRAEEAGLPDPAATRSGAAEVAAWWLKRRGRLVPGGGLSPQGRLEAEMVVRSHRLWETWLGRHVRLPLDHLHPPAEWIEHYLGAEMRQRLEQEMAASAAGPAEADPHGSTIPPEPSLAAEPARTSEPS
jgi:manganese/zinc/iron transport system permease protein